MARLMVPSSLRPPLLGELMVGPLDGHPLPPVQSQARWMVNSQFGTPALPPVPSPPRSPGRETEKDVNHKEKTETGWNRVKQSDAQ